MRLYFKPGACSLASRIVLAELGLSYEAVAVDTEAARTADGRDYRRINPKGYVPALEFEPGHVLTENPAILQYLADLRPSAGLAPEAGSLDRARLQEWLNFTSSELHKAFSPFFSGRALSEDEAGRAHGALERRLGDVERLFADGRRFALGDTFSVADAYLFVVLGWAGAVGVRLDAWPSVAAYVERVAARPAVRLAADLDAGRTEAA